MISVEEYVLLVGISHDKIRFKTVKETIKKRRFLLGSTVWRKVYLRRILESVSYIAKTHVIVVRMTLVIG